MALGAHTLYVAVSHPKHFPQHKDDVRAASVPVLATGPPCSPRAGLVPAVTLPT